MIPPNTSDSTLRGNGNGSPSAVQEPLVGGNQLIPTNHNNLPMEIQGQWNDTDAYSPMMEPPEEGIHFFDLIHSLRRRWIAIVGFSILIVPVFVALIWFLMPVNETAQSYFYIRFDIPTIGDKIRRGNVQEFEQLKKAQAAVIGGGPVLSKALMSSKIGDENLNNLAMLKNEDDKIAFLQKYLKISFPKQAGLMVISLSGQNGKECKKIVQRITRVYIEEVLDKKKRDINKKYNNLVNARDSKLITRSELRDKLARANNDLNLAELENYKEERSSLSRIKLSLNATRQEYSDQVGILRLSQKTNRAVPPQVLQETLRTDPVYINLFQLVQQHKQFLIQLGTTLKKQHIKYRTQEKILNSVTNELAQYEAEVKDRLRKSLTGNNSKEQLKQLQVLVRTKDTEIGLVNQKIHMLNKNIETIERENNKPEIIESVSKIKQLDGEISDLSLTIQSVELEQNVLPRISQEQETHIPPSTDFIFKIIIISGVGVIVFSLVGVSIIAWDNKNKVIGGSGEIPERLQMELIGTLPALHGRGLRGVKLETVLTDSIDGIRTALIHGAKHSNHRVVLVTSATDREGKTTLATQLAASLARCGRKTLLVDGDMRSPSLHQLFNMPQDRGISEVLRGSLDLNDAVRPTPAENLWLMSAGNSDYTSIQSLENDGIGGMFERLKTEFDFIIIDTPPVLAFADPMLIGQHVDGAILSTRLDVSQRPKVQAAYDRLRSVGIWMFGVVVNGAKSNTSHRSINTHLISK